MFYSISWRIFFFGLHAWYFIILRAVVGEVAFLLTYTHRTKYQESVNGNVVEICETVAETQRSTRVSARGLVTFTRVSVAAVPTEPDHFFTRFRQVSVEGNV